jgi:hypothetical protein
VDLLPACATGLVVMGISTLVLCSLGVMKPFIAWLLVGLVTGVSIRQVASVLRRIASASFSGFDPVDAVIIAVMGFALVACLISCLAPLTANDALVYHLNIPKIYASSGALSRLPSNVYANMPHYGEILYTLFYSAAGETGAKIFYFFLVAGAAAAVYSLARRFVERRWAVIAASVFLVQPLVLDYRIICNVDMLLAFLYVSAIIIAFDTWKSNERARSLLVVSLLAGFMLGIKYTAIAPCVSLLAVPLARPGRQRDRRLVVAGIIIAAAVFGPWLVKNETYVGNPFYPLLEGTFDGSNWESLQGTQLVSWQRGMGMGRGLADYLLLPFNISTKAKAGLNYSRFDGTMTPVLLILIPLIFLKKRREISVLAVMAAIGFVFWAFTAQQLRFLVPTLAVLAVMAGIGFSNLSERIGKKWIGVTVLLIILIEVCSLVVSDQYGRPFLSNAFGDRLPVVTGMETRRQYLQRVVQPFSMFEHINGSLPANEPVLLIWENRAYYLDRPYFADSFFEASTLARMASDARTPAALKHKIKQRGYRHVVVNDMLGEVFSRRYQPQEMAVIKGLIVDHLEPLHSSNRLTLYALKPD